MKNLKILFSSMIMFVAFATVAQQYKADVQKSKVQWTAEKLTGKHTGKITIKDGDLTLKSGKISAGSFTMDMNSIIDEDVQSAEYNAKLVNHIKSDDFFGVAKFPEAKLVITKATAFKNNVAEITSNITIKGKTNPNVFKVTKNGDTYTASIVIDRSKFDVKYGSKTFFEDIGDKIIYDEFKLEVQLVVVK